MFIVWFAFGEHANRVNIGQLMGDTGFEPVTSTV
jgi:hypothetical protein